MTTTTEEPTTTEAAATDHRQAPSVVDMWSGEYGDTLTGFDEVAIGKAFGANLDALAARGGLDAVRALVFTHRRREGDDDKAAKKFALEATRREVADYFAGLGMPTMPRPEAEGKD